MFLISSSGGTPLAQDKDALTLRTSCPLANVLGLARLMVRTRRWLIASRFIAFLEMGLMNTESEPQSLVSSIQCSNASTGQSRW